MKSLYLKNEIYPFLLVVATPDLHRELVALTDESMIFLVDLDVLMILAT